MPSNVPERKLPRFSATRVKSFDQCARKWHLYNVRGWDNDLEKQGWNPAFEFGTKMHTVAENWLRDGTIPPDNEFGRAFKPGIEHWPAPTTPHMFIEKRFQLEVAEGLQFRGIIDVLIDAGDRMIVGDHKTTGNMRYAMKPAELCDDVQALAYGYYATTISDAEDVTLRWVYYSKKKPEARKVEITKPRQYFIDQWASIMEKTEKMLAQWEDNGYAEDIPGHDLESWDSPCAMYGGCEFKAQCKALKKEKPKMNKLDEILNRAKSPAPEQPSLPGVLEAADTDSTAHPHPLRRSAEEERRVGALVLDLLETLLK